MQAFGIRKMIEIHVSTSPREITMLYVLPYPNGSILQELTYELPYKMRKKPRPSLSLQITMETMDLEQVYTMMGRALMTGDLRVFPEPGSKNPWGYLEKNGVDQKPLLANCLTEGYPASPSLTDILLSPLFAVGPRKGESYCWLKLSFQRWKSADLLK